jgi:Ca2+-binding RTX toxin-like protein
VFLTDASDTYTGALGERIVGGKGADTINIGAGNDALGEQGNDIITGNDDGNGISGGLGDDTIDGRGEADTLFGDAGNDVIFGGDGADNLSGGTGSDILYGGAGVDQIHGGLGKDFLWGGSENDFYIFDSLADSGRGANRDVLEDFNVLELIDISAIDAKKAVAGNQDFKLIGTAHFHDRAGELRYVTHDLAGTENDRTIVQGDVNGDGRADFEIEIVGIHVLTTDEFIGA